MDGGGESDIKNTTSYTNTNDEASDNEEEGEGKNTKKNFSKLKLPFPWKLHQLLDDMARDGHEDIASWLPGGKSFRIHKPEEFSKDIMSNYFRQTKFTSFIRQLYIYGFSKIDSGPCLGGYFHPNFIRGERSVSLTLGRNQFGDRRCKQIQQQQAALLQAAESVARNNNHSMLPPIGQQMSGANNNNTASGSTTTTGGAMMNMTEQVLLPGSSRSSLPLPGSTFVNNPFGFQTSLSEDVFSIQSSSSPTGSAGGPSLAVGSSTAANTMTHRNSSSPLSQQHIQGRGMVAAAMQQLQQQQSITEYSLAGGGGLAAVTNNNDNHGGATTRSDRGDQFVQSTSLSMAVPMQTASSSSINDFLPPRRRLGGGGFQNGKPAGDVFSALMMMSGGKNNDNNLKEQSVGILATTKSAIAASSTSSGHQEEPQQWAIDLEPRTIEEMTQHQGGTTQYPAPSSKNNDHDL